MNIIVQNWDLNSLVYGICMEYQLKEQLEINPINKRKMYKVLHKKCHMLECKAKKHTNIQNENSDDPKKILSKRNLCKLHLLARILLSIPTRELSVTIKFQIQMHTHTITWVSLIYLFLYAIGMIWLTV